MAHEIVYGICENKCKVEVVPKEQLLDLIYPVGAIYMSVNNTNPSTLFGGTWVAWGAGRVPVGIGTGTDSNGNKMSFGTPEGTGGEYTHKLTENELPTSVRVTLEDFGLETFDIQASSSGDGYDTWVAGDGFTGNMVLGGNAYHNNVQPYISCYMWKRTA